MARIFELKDASLTVNLLDTSGIIPMRQVQGFQLGEDQLFGDERFAAETLRLNLIGTSTDNVATQKQNFITLLRRAIGNRKNGRSHNPVYLKQQLTGETNPRYAEVLSVPMLEEPAVLRNPLELDHIIENFGLQVIRENPWSSRIPGTYPANPLTQTATDGPAGETLGFVVNVHDELDLTDIYNYDATGPTFSANLLGTDVVKIWQIGANPPAAGDWIIFGGGACTIVLPIETPGDFTADLQIKYSKAGGFGAWGTLTQGVGYISFPDSVEDSLLKTYADRWVISVKPPADWAADNINGVNTKWIGIYLNGVTAWVTSPETDKAIYAQRKNYIEIPNTALTGDGRPLVMTRLVTGYGGSTTPMFGNISRILIGARSPRANGLGLTGFLSNLLLGNTAPPTGWNWTLAAGTDTTLAHAVLDAPGGAVARCTFAGDASMQTRVTMTGASKLQYYEGKFKLLLQCQQIGGADGDCYVRSIFKVGANSTRVPTLYVPRGNGIPLQSHDAGAEWIDLTQGGYLKIPFGLDMPADNLSANLYVLLQASRASGAAELYFYQLVFLPIDEYALDLRDPIADSTNGTSALRGNSCLEADPGIVAYRTLKKFGSTTALTSMVPAEPWLGSGHIHKLEPNTQYRFYVMMFHYPTSWGVGPMVGCKGMFLAVQLYGAGGYTVLRGAA